MNAAPDAALLAALRSTVYRLLLAALDKPSPAQHERLREPSFRASLALLCEQFGISELKGELVPESFADFESRYLATFEVGLPEAPVVLLASRHLQHEPAPRIVHEHILFYRHFDAQPQDETGEAADHLLNELRFLIHLDELSERDPSSREAIDRARGDFLDRHLLRWVPAACTQALGNSVPAFYRAALRLLDAVLREDRRMLESPQPEAVPPC